MTLPTYSTGTVSVSNGGTVVTGAGTIWSGANVKEGDFFVRADGMALITAVTDNTHFTITPWPGATVSGGAYTIEQIYSGRVVGVAAAQDVGTMLKKLHTSGLPFLVGIDETVPDPSLGDDGQYGYKPNTGAWWLKTAGVWVQSVSPLVGYPAPIFTFEGDSLSNPSHLGTWTTQLAAKSAFFARGTKHFFAVDGDYASAMVGEYATEAGSIAIASGQEAYFFLWAGGNDIERGDAATTVYNNLKTLWAAARASGYKVVAFTLEAFVNDSWNGVRDTLNALILSDSTLYDFLVRLEGVLFNPKDPTVFLPDTIHPNSYGMGLIADEVIRTVLGTKSVYATAGNGRAGGLQTNGNIDVNQALPGGSGLTSGTSLYVADSWACLYVNAAAAVGVAQQALTGSLALSGHSNGVAMLATTAVSSMTNGDIAVFSNTTEGYDVACLGWGVGRSQPLSYGFRFYSTAPGTILIRITNSALTQFMYHEKVVAAGWNWVTGTIVPPPNGSVWQTTNAAGVIFQIIMAGKATSPVAPNAWTSSFVSQSTSSTNLLSANGNVCLVTGFLLLPGIEIPSAARAPLIMRPYAQELILCQRQLEIATVALQTSGTGFAISTYPFKTSKRTSPAMSTLTAPTYTNASGATFNSATIEGVGLQFQTSAASGSAVGWKWMADSRL